MEHRSGTPPAFGQWSAVQDVRLLKLEITPRSIVWVLATIVSVWLFIQLRGVMLLLLVALVFAGTFNPLVEWAEKRGVRRGWGLVMLFLTLLSVTFLLVFLTVPPVVEQLVTLVSDAPAHRERLIALFSRYDLTAPVAGAWQKVGVDETLAGIQSYLLGYAPRALMGLGYAVTTLALTFYLLADGKRAQGAIYAVVPRSYHMRLARILQNLETIVGGYMRGQLITSIAIGVFTFGLLLACRVPNALSIALFAALVDVVPFVGGFLAAAPAVLAGFGVGVPTGAVILGSMLVYQEVENRVIIPNVYGKVLRLSSITVVLALLAGGVLHGVIGALLALPIAAGIKMMISELRVELPGDDSADLTALVKDARTEAVYERMSAGATAPEAGQIARQLATDIRDGEAIFEANADEDAKASTVKDID